MRRKRGGAKTISVQEMEVDGIPVLLRLKNMRSITMRVKDSESPVEVSAPVGTSRFAVEQFVRAKRTWILRQQLRQDDSPMVRANEASAQEVAAWRAIVEGLAPGLVAHWAAVMGVTPGKIAYRNMKTRWGSCQPATGRICINVRLALYPPHCLEYVVVHELAHLLVSGHDSSFYAVLDRYLPDWRHSKNVLDGR